MADKQRTIPEEGQPPKSKELPVQASTKRLVILTGVVLVLCLGLCDFFLALGGVNVITNFAVVHIPIMPASARGQAVAGCTGVVAGSVGLWTFFFNTWEKRDLQRNELEHDRSQRELAALRDRHRMVYEDLSKSTSALLAGNDTELLSRIPLVLAHATSYNPDAGDEEAKYPLLLPAMVHLSEAYFVKSLDIDCEPVLDGIVGLIRRSSNLGTTFADSLLRSLCTSSAGKSTSAFRVIENWVQKLESEYQFEYDQRDWYEFSVTINRVLVDRFRSTGIDFDVRRDMLGEYAITRPRSQVPGALPPAPPSKKTVDESELLFDEDLHCAWKDIFKASELSARLIYSLPSQSHSEQITSKIRFRGLVFINRSFFSLSLNNVSFEGCVFVNCTFGQVVFECVRFTNVRFLRSNLHSCTFDRTTFQEVTVIDTVFGNVQFDDCTVNFLSFFNCRTGLLMSFCKSRLSRVTYFDCDIASLSLRDCEIDLLSLHNSNIFLFEEHSSKVNLIEVSDIEDFSGEGGSLIDFVRKHQRRTVFRKMRLAYGDGGRVARLVHGDNDQDLFLRVRGS